MPLSLCYRATCWRARRLGVISSSLLAKVHLCLWQGFLDSLASLTGIPWYDHFISTVIKSPCCCIFWMRIDLRSRMQIARGCNIIDSKRDQPLPDVAHFLFYFYFLYYFRWQSIRGKNWSTRSNHRRYRGVLCRLMQANQPIEKREINKNPRLWLLDSPIQTAAPSPALSLPPYIMHNNSGSLRINRLGMYYIESSCPAIYAKLPSYFGAIQCQGSIFAAADTEMHRIYLTASSK